MEKVEKAARKIMDLHGRVAYLAGVALRAQGCEKIAIDLAEIRTELSLVFDLLRPQNVVHLHKEESND